MRTLHQQGKVCASSTSPIRRIQLRPGFTRQREPLAGFAPLTVTFSNQSTGVYTASLWNFGDGATGTLTNPTHTFTSVGAYTVTLTVSGPEDTNTAIKPAFIAVVEPRGYLPIVMRD